MLGLGDKKKPAYETRRRAVIDTDSSYLRTHTISGYDPSVAMEKEAKILERKKLASMRQRKNKLTAATVCLLVIIAVNIIGLFQYAGNISDVNFVSQVTNSIDKPRYISVADDYFREHPIERFSFALNNQNFSDYFAQNAREIESATINYRAFLSGELSLKARSPVAVWQADGQKKYIDSNGVVFELNLMSEPEIIIEDNAIGAISTLPTKFLRFIGKVIAGIEYKGVERVEKVVIPLRSIRFVEFHLQGRSYPFKAHIDRDAQSQVDDILNTISFLDQRNIVPREYVNNMVEGKAFWK